MSKSIPEAALAWAVQIANDQTHGYSQQNRNGPDYDCSSLVLSAFRKAGADVGQATYTGNMRSELLKHGFSDVTASINLASGANLKPGDILLYHIGGTAGHTALYAGQGQIVHARGQSYGSSKPGDQGTEIAVTPYYRGKWATVLRYTGTQAVKTVIRRYKVETELPMLQKGDTGKAVRVWQIIVGVDPDGEFGYLTKAATLTFQTAHNLEVDGVVGPESWAAGLKLV